MSDRYVPEKKRVVYVEEGCDQLEQPTEESVDGTVGYFEGKITRKNIVTFFKEFFKNPRKNLKNLKKKKSQKSQKRSQKSQKS